MGWKDTIEEEVPSWKDSIQEEPVAVEELEPTKPSSVLSAKMGISKMPMAALNNEEAIRLGSNAATFGQQPRISAAVEHLLSKRPYNEALKSNQSEISRLRSEHPLAAGAIELPVGIAASAPISGLSWPLRILASGVTGGAMTAGQQDLSTSEGWGNTAQGTAISGGLGAVGELFNFLPNKQSLSRSAEKMAENATHVSANQLSKLPENSGRTMLDEGMVKAFDSPLDIAARAEQRVLKANQGIDTALSGLDEQGAFIDKQEMVDRLQKRVNELSNSGAKQDVIRKLQRNINDIKSTPSNSFPLSEAEVEKRLWQSKSNYAKPISTEANKITANEYRNAVENEALSINPELSDLFTTSKKEYSFAEPLREMTEKKGIQMQQSPIGNFTDMASLGGGIATGNPYLASVPFAKRIIAPRAASTLAVSMDKLSKMIPNMGEYAPLLTSAAQKGAQYLAITHYLLSKDPNYQQLFNQEENR